MTHRTTPDTTDIDTTDTQGAASADASPARTSRRVPPAAVRRPALYLAMAAAGALLVNVVTAGEPPARADAQLQSVSIAQQLGLSKSASAVTPDDAAGTLGQLAASRSERQSEQTAAAQAQSAADKAVRDRRAAEAAAKKAAQEAAQKAAAKKAADEAAAKKAAQEAAQM